MSEVKQLKKQVDILCEALRISKENSAMLKERLEEARRETIRRNARDQRSESLVLYERKRAEAWKAVAQSGRCFCESELGLCDACKKARTARAIEEEMER